MCELLGMSANVPTDICFSITGLIARGGGTGPHKDGWGVAFYEGKGVREFRDPAPGTRSPVAELVKCYPIKSKSVISHIRRANSGKVCLENTHPFVREMWGRHWTFAHNGQLRGVKKLPTRYYKPVGTTDSEHAFCWMMSRIRQRFSEPPRSNSELFRCVKGLADQLHRLGVFNLLLCDSRHLYAYCATKLCWITRRAPFGRATLKDTELVVDFSKETTPNDIVTVIATEPLTTNERWNICSSGEMLVFQDGLKKRFH